MMKTAAAAVVATLWVSTAHAQVTVDGARDAAYGSAKSSVTYDPNAPTSNFGAPAPTTSGESYDIYLTSDASNVYGFIQATGQGASAGAFANLYFDIDPQNGNGSDLGFEITNKRAFVPGVDGYAPVNVSFATGADGSLEFSIPDVDFTQAISGLSYYPGQAFPSTGDKVTLRLSQSLGYSVAGGATYGADRLGSVEIGGDAVSAAPEPGAWALMMLGVGFIGWALGLRKRVQADHRAKLALIP